MVVGSIPDTAMEPVVTPADHGGGHYGTMVSHYNRWKPFLKRNA